MDYIRRLNVPVLILGGGGYTMRNVARCWAFETAVLTGHNVDNAMPHNDYFEYYGPDYLLHIRQSNMVRPLVGGNTPRPHPERRSIANGCVVGCALAPVS